MGRIRKRYLFIGFIFYMCIRKYIVFVVPDSQHVSVRQLSLRVKPMVLMVP